MVFSPRERPMWTHCIFMVCWLEFPSGLEQKPWRRLTCNFSLFQLFTSLQPCGQLLEQASGTSSLTVTCMLFAPTLEAYLQRPPKRGTLPHQATEPSSLADDSEISPCPWRHLHWVQRKGKRSVAIVLLQRKDDKHVSCWGLFGALFELIFNSEQNLLIPSCIRWSNNSLMPSNQKPFPFQ